MDVKITFLNASLEETIDMGQPQGFVIRGQEKRICNMIKSINGLKQPS